MMIPGHRRTADLVKDWQPGFNEAVRELYRCGLDALAEEAERCGHVHRMPRMRGIGEIVRKLLAQVTPTERHNADDRET